MESGENGYDFQGEKTLVPGANRTERYCGQGQQIRASLPSPQTEAVRIGLITATTENPLALAGLHSA
jgi:hypothetical protein